MNLEIYKDYEALSNHAADAIISCITNKPEATICLASGSSPKRTCEIFVQRVIAEKINISQSTILGLDEWVGIPPDNEGSCTYFFHHNILQPLQWNVSQYHLFDGMSDNLDAECEKMNTIIANKGGIDLMIVGVGMNGHIGFNEPGVAIRNYAHVTDLDDVTQTVGQKYFSTPVTINKGITLGLQHLLDAKKVIMLANGMNKAAVIKRMMNEEIGNQFPATVMRMHGNSILMIDETAASQL